ncbi:type II toxin-antitoxin system HicB family antitoxin [Citrobacter freundii]|uniref:type II toxin-antitoxin system HicB family antitoxin n=1 Tax=Citrobacter TaxID=544 RepID=UPI001DBEFFBE|nr:MULTISPECIES: type II toxin-antitoxin system HicB family antitoxin [Citrobacter]MBJ8796740.1 type II toxin-antitoxin system HicB family antitoxin [Citrobacter freundii]MDM2915103.1 type II toxin-antitoxin system HicB family antitoxin [Citrobacter sp. Cpo035]MDV1612781.1 toxin-antitoxin system HicB family antitoxin [Citrobacter portucalensis]MEB0546921.1 type II toxin-antitoxin system HicB family antitoxin [Citrobacter portucalensis]
MYNAEEYTISVRKERMDEDVYWVARVEELPDILEFGETRDEAYELAIDTINTGQEMCFAEGTHFPSPKNFVDANVSGRVTLRLPKSVHANCIKLAEEEGVSLNSYILTCITSYRSVQETVIRTSLFEDIRNSLISITNLRSHGALFDQSEFAYSRRGQFKIALDHINGDDNYESRAISFISPFDDINEQGWSSVSAC